MGRKEPYASQKEYDKYIIHYEDVPAVELASGLKSRIISAEIITLRFVSAEPNAQLPPNRHENEQMMIVLDGDGDYIIEGKLYHVQKGDIVVLPPNTEHGGYDSNTGCRVIDVFSPPRQDFVAKLEEVRKSKE